ncbi:MAG: hypothetical protein NWQ45_03565 [Congregibacter sp.]|nr:hypothetical protein [Congregibacter sp.]
MAIHLYVSILSQDEVHTLSNAWEPDALKKVLALADADDIGEVGDDALEEFVLMSLQDAGNRKAAEIVLEAVFADEMRPGVRQNLVDDLQEDKPWDDFAEISQQRGIFVAVCLLQKAFPRHYGTPDATRLTVRFQAKTPAGLAAIHAGDSASLVRLLACGLSENNIVHRLFSDELKSGPLTEAAGLIWEAESMGIAKDNELSQTISITASSLLLGSFIAGREFKAMLHE